MKTLSADTTERIDSIYNEPIRLAKVEFSGLTIYLCSRIFGAAGVKNVFDSVSYEPIVLQWGEISHGTIDPMTSKRNLSSTSIVIDNSVPVAGFDSFTAMFATYKAQYAIVTVYDIHNHFLKPIPVSGDEVTRFYGQIEDLVDMDERQCVLICSGLDTYLSKQYDYSVVNSTDYPQSHPNDYDKVMPEVFGSAKKVRLMAIDPGAITSIVTSFTDSSPANGATFDVASEDLLPAAGAFTMKVDEEELRISSRSGKTLTLDAVSGRAYNGTIATAHSAGSVCAEVQAEYIYGVGHKIKVWSDIYIWEDTSKIWVEIDSANYTTYTGQVGSQHGTYSSIAVVAFTERPQILAQIAVDVEVTQQPDVDDQPTFTNPAPSQGAITQPTFTNPAPAQGAVTQPAFSGTATKTINPDGQTNSNTSNPTYAYDGNDDSYADVYDASFSSYLELEFPTTSYGTITKQTFWLRLGRNASGTIKIYKNSGSLIEIGELGASAPTGYYRYETNDTNWDCEVRVSCDAGEQALVYEVYKEVEYTEDFTRDTDVAVGNPTIGNPSIGTNVAVGNPTIGNPSISQQVAIAGSGGTEVQIGVTAGSNTVANLTIGAMVSADMDGYQDPDGDYGGVGTLIERPDWITKFVLVNKCGLAAARINTTAYTAAGSSYSSESFTLAFAMNTPGEINNAIPMVMFQCNSIDYWTEDTHAIKYIGGANPSSWDKILDKDRIDKTSISTVYSPTSGIANYCVVPYNKDWSGYDDPVTQLRSTVISEDATSQSDFGVKRVMDILLPGVPVEAHAQTVGDWLIGQRAQSKLLITLEGGCYLDDLDFGDTIAFDFTDDSGAILDKALLYMVTPSDTLFRVIDIIDGSPGHRKIMLYELGAKS